VYSINATFVTTCNTTKVRAFDVIVLRPSTSINVKIISITRIYFVFFWESRNDRLNEFAMLIYIYNNVLRSSNEPTTLHCVESYLYYVILVNTKISSEEWNEGEKKTRQYCRNRQHCRKYKIYIYEFDEFFLPVLQRVEMNYIFSDNVRILYLSCYFKSPNETVKLSKKSRNKRYSNRFRLWPLWSPRL
jgi:hypothetical protein